MKLKNSVFAFIFLLTTTVSLFGDEKLSKVSKYLNEDNVYFFNGFDFNAKEESSHNIGLDEYVDAEIRDVLQKRKGKSSEYTIVGYSEGGLRALAYAKRLKEQNPDEYKKLKAVITVSGIDKGLKAMKGCSEINGFTPLKAKIQEDVDIIYNGIGGFVVGMPATSFFLGIFGGITLLDNKDDVVAVIKEMTPYLDGYIGTALKGGSYSELAEIYDMMPDSKFINDNVSATESVLYKKKVDEKPCITTKSIKIFGITVYYIALEMIPIYKTFVAYKDVPRFDSDLPVGYIVGTDSNTLGMLDSDIESDIREGAAAVSKAMYVAEAVNITKLVASLGICSFYGTCASYCDKAGKWFGNIDGEMNELKGSKDNDGLVAKESQFYPMSFQYTDEFLKKTKTSAVHTKVLGDVKTGYLEVPSNHMMINPTDFFVRNKKIEGNSDTRGKIQKMIEDADELKNRISDEK